MAKKPRKASKRPTSKRLTSKRPTSKRPTSKRPTPKPAIKKRKPKIYRDGYGRFTSKENAAAIIEISRGKVTEKGKERKLTKQEATDLIYEKKIKVDDGGFSMLQNVESDIDYMLKNNPNLKVKIRGAGNEYFEVRRGRKGYMYAAHAVKIAWRRLRELFGVGRTDSPPPEIEYTTKSYAGQSPFEIIIDFNDIVYDGIQLFNPEG